MISETKQVELVKALTDKPKSAAELKDELKIEESSKSVGKVMKRIADTNENIVVDKYQGVHLYSVKPSANPMNSNPSLKNIVQELKDAGINTQEVCYIALQNKKAALDKEMKFIETNAPTFMETYDRLKDRLKKAINQIEDMHDEMNRLTSRKMVRGLIEQRKAGVA